MLLKHEKANVKLIFFDDDAYPSRLREIPDAPPWLYVQGNVDLNATKIVSIVGTRKATQYGKKIVGNLIHELSNYDVLMVSGLAYGIDIAAHSMALQYGIPTLGVIAGGLDMLYPSIHKKTAIEMMQYGGIMSEYALKTQPEAHQFPARNRIIAGIADATLVIEAGKKSGALITANLANEYDREVFAVPGNLYASYSAGCNHLIKTHRANVLTSVEDIVYLMNWDVEKPTHTSKKNSTDGLLGLTASEKNIVQALEKSPKALPIDALSYETKISLNQLYNLLLTLELKEIVQCLPGKKFKLNVA